MTKKIFAVSAFVILSSLTGLVSVHAKDLRENSRFGPSVRSIASELNTILNACVPGKPFIIPMEGYLSISRIEDGKYYIGPKCYSKLRCENGDFPWEIKPMIFHCKK